MHAYKPEPWSSSTPSTTYAAAPPSELAVKTDVDGKYEKDFVQWVEEQARLLRARDFAALDLENLIEEIDAMARTQKQQLMNRLKVIVQHLLKCQFQPEQLSSSWRGTLLEQRSRISGLLEDSPSLKQLVEASAARRYSDALRAASEETGLARTVFPNQNPYTSDQMLDPDYLP